MPIVEPETLMDGDHDLAACEDATGRALQGLYEQLRDHRVDLAGTLLKVNMVVPGKGAADAGGRPRDRGGHPADAYGRTCPRRFPGSCSSPAG